MVKELNIRAGNQFIARFAGFTESLKQVNLQYKDDCIVDITMLIRPPELDRAVKFIKNDTGELLITDLGKFVANIFIIPGLMEIPESLSILDGRILNIHDSEEQLLEVFKLINKNCDIKFTPYVFTTPNESTPNGYTLNYIDHSINRRATFEGVQETKLLSKFQALTRFVEWKSTGDRSNLKKGITF